MPNKISASVIGERELLAAFDQLDTSVKRDALATAGQAGALPILNAAKQKAPKRTRTLARSLHSEVVEADDRHVVVEIGTDLEYAAIHEYGGTIVPKTAKYLAIPLSDAAKAAGSPRGFDGLHFQPTAKGGVLVDEAGSAHYALVRSVTLPARPYLRPALDEKQGEAVDEVERALRLILDAIGV